RLPLIAVVLTFAGVLLFLLLLLEVLPALPTAAVPEILHAIGRDLGLHDRLVVGVLHCLGIIRGVHHVQVVIAREYDGLVVWGNRRPGRLAQRTLFEELQTAAREFVLEGELLLVAGRRRRKAALSAPALLLRLVDLLVGILLLLRGVALRGQRRVL